MLTLTKAPLVILTAGVTLLAATPAAHAVDPDNLVPTANYDHDCQVAAICKTDNATVTYYMDSGGSNELEAGDKASVQWVIDNEYAPTDLVMKYDSDPTFSGDAETDWYIVEETVSGDANGRAICNDAIWWTYKCDQHHVKIESGFWQHGLVCHELGHATGFVHGDLAAPTVAKSSSDNGCNRDPVPSTAGLNANQVTRINNN
ncbi:MAG: hypothetical protein ACI379_10685 [Nocardioides sp.]|uniref:hypothetical protein n=1 Tax=Nocardioides sp. TaxID=35761 RepID=UPI003EFF87BF